MINPVLLARNKAIAAEELLLDALADVEKFDKDDEIGSPTERLIRIRGDLIRLIDDLEKEMEARE